MSTKKPRSFLGISSFEALAMFRRGLFYNYLSIYLRYYLGLSVTETTFFCTAPMCVNVIFQTFVWGPISDKYQLRRTLVICGEILGAVGTVAIWYSHTLTDSKIAAGYIIIAGLSVVEIFWSMSNIGWSALISDIYTPGERNRVKGRLASIGGLSRIGGVWAGGLLYDGLELQYLGWGFEKGALFFVAAGAMLISTIPMFFVSEGGITLQKGDLSKDSGCESAYPAKIFWVFIVALFLINLGRNSVAIIRAQYLVLESGFAVSSRMLSYVMNAESVAMVLAGFFTGYIAVRLGNKKSICLGAILAITSLMMFAFLSDIEMIYLANFVRGISDVIIIASSYAFASILIPAARRARLFSIYNATFFLSWGLAGTFLAGPVIDILISMGKTEVFAYQMSFLAAGIMTFSGLVLLAILIYKIIPGYSQTK